MLVLLALFMYQMMHESSAEHFSTIVHVIAFASALALSFLQETRQLQDAWYAQPLMWSSLVLTSLIPEIPIGEDGSVLTNSSHIENVMVYLALTAVCVY